MIRYCVLRSSSYYLYDEQPGLFIVLRIPNLLNDVQRAKVLRRGHGSGMV